MNLVSKVKQFYRGQAGRGGQRSYFTPPLMRSNESRANAAPSRSLSRSSAPKQMIMPQAQVQALAPIIKDGITDQPYNAESLIHEKSIKLQIYNPAKKADNSDNPTMKAVISAGDHSSLFPGRLLLEGTNDMPNDGNQVEGLRVTIDYGHSNVSSLTNFHRMIREKGLQIVGMRYKFRKDGDPQNDSQGIHKFKLWFWDEFGNHTYRNIDPEVHENPNHFKPNFFEMGSQFVLNRDTISELDIQPGFTVDITLYLAGILNLDRLLIEDLKINGIGRVLDQ